MPLAWAATAVVLGTLGASSPQAAALRSPDSEAIQIVGDRAVPASVYRHLVEQAGLGPDPEGARAACARIEGFLQAAGYVYAEARCAAKDDQLVVVVDEGTIERVAFPGQSGLTAVAGAVAFRLEGRVFNRAEFARSVARLERALGTRVTGYELVRTSTQAEVPFQLSDVEELADFTGMTGGGRYVLRLHLENEFMSPGFGFGLGATGPDGLITELRYRWADVARRDDRVKIWSEVGLRVTEVIGGDPPPLVSRAGAGVARFSPELGVPGLRWFARLSTSYLNRLRRDLNDASYDLLEPQVGVGLAWRRGEFRQLKVAVGADYRALIAADLASTEAAPRTTGFARGYVDLEGDWSLFMPPSGRLDHSLLLGGYVRAYATDAPYVDTRLTIEKGFRLGRYNEIRFEARGVALAGGYGLVDEYRVSDLFRGLYGDELYTARAATLSTEAFLSLERERVRASAFVDGLAFRSSEIATGRDRVQPGFATGLGLHALFFETYQGSVYVLMGLVNGRSIDGGFNLSLARIF